jgi:hypothetical protein
MRFSLVPARSGFIATSGTEHSFRRSSGKGFWPDRLSRGPGKCLAVKQVFADGKSARRDGRARI